MDGGFARMLAKTKSGILLSKIQRIDELVGSPVFQDGRGVDSRFVGMHFLANQGFVDGQILWSNFLPHSCKASK